MIIDKARAGEIEVARSEDGRQLQVLAIASYQPLNFGSAFHADDINFDGYPDFSVVCEFAASSGYRRSYRVYDPGSQLFAQNELTHELADWWGFIEVDPAKHQITRQYFGAMMGCPNTREGREERYRVNNNRLLLVHKQDFEREPQSCTVTESDMLGGAMRVTGVRRFNPQGQRVKRSQAPSWNPIQSALFIRLPNAAARPRSSQFPPAARGSPFLCGRLRPVKRVGHFGFQATLRKEPVLKRGRCMTQVRPSVSI